MASTLDIRRRIKSVKNTRQITRAMEKISAIKMRKAQTAALKSRRYASLAWEMMRALEGNVEKNLHPLLSGVKQEAPAGFLVISPDKGLCGSLPTRLMQKAAASAEGGVSSEQARWYTIGKKGRDALVRMGARLEADFTGASAGMGSVSPVISAVVADYLSGKIGSVHLVYTDFVNTLTQKATLKQMLPLEVQADEKEHKQVFQYVFEPSPEDVLEHLLIRIFELQVYQAILESSASEHSARMVAMKSASENAGELIGDLTLAYNQVRQAGITREIAEISAGRIAME